MATKYSSPFLLYCNNTPFNAWLNKSVSTIYLKLGLKWAKIKAIIKQCFKLLKAYLYLGVYSNFTFFFIEFING